MIYVGTSRVRGGNFRNLLPAWNYAAEDSVRISCFTNVEEAELFMNGTSLGRKKRAEFSNNIISWLTKFSAGELMVKGYNNGGEVNRYLVKTASEPETIRAEIDSAVLLPGSMAHIENLFT